MKVHPLAGPISLAVILSIWVGAIGYMGFANMGCAQEKPKLKIVVPPIEHKMAAPPTAAQKELPPPPPVAKVKPTPPASTKQPELEDFNDGTEVSFSANVARVNGVYKRSETEGVNDTVTGEWHDISEKNKEWFAEFGEPKVFEIIFPDIQAREEFWQFNEKEVAVVGILGTGALDKERKIVRPTITVVAGKEFKRIKSINVMGVNYEHVGMVPYYEETKEMGEKHPHVTQSGFLLDYDEKINWYVYHGTSFRAYWIQNQLSGGKALRTLIHVRYDGKKFEFLDGPSGKWTTEEPSDADTLRSIIKQSHAAASRT